MTDAPSTDTRISAFGWLAILVGAALLGHLIYYNVTHLHAGHGAEPAAEASLASDAAGGGGLPAHAAPSAEHATPGSPASLPPQRAVAPPLWGVGVMPFVLLLASIAVLPLLPFTHHWWESNLNRLPVVLACAGLALTYNLLSKGWHSILPVLDHAVPAE
jgi:hypothetical protein